ncbi:MAG TPA: phosphoribosylamine--glycine ligase [Chthonomonadales bacterium]|nr:phosphoribosylamine--glycine ligase [Chthonomonadales bacterium]
MRVLVIGGGGREHALAWKLSASSHVDRIYCAPGNAGIARIAECINLEATDQEGLASFAASQHVDLTVVGPEGPLTAGIVDRFEARGLPVFGPATEPARIEGSKAFSKELMVRYGIATADYRAFEHPDEAHAYIVSRFAGMRESCGGLVVKADGIAAGKGVFVVDTAEQAHAAVDTVMRERAFGAAGDRIIVEERLTGEEVSIMAFTDGENVVAMPPSQDHKRVFDNDLGPNTGGMGAYSPTPSLPADIVHEAVETVVRPAVHAIRDLGIPYKGVLYAGLMLTPKGIRVLEFNCRFGDPETQAVLPLLETDLVEVLSACVDCSLDQLDVRWKREAAVCVVAASGGYPGDYATGKPIEGLDRAAEEPGCMIFHAGTREEHGQVYTDGGRVLGVTGTGADIPEALAHAYTGMARIRFEGMHFRRDIAARALKARA